MTPMMMIMMMMMTMVAADAAYIPGSSDLVLHFNSAKPAVDLMYKRQASPSWPATVDLSKDDVLWTRQVREPIDLELIGHQLIVRTAVPNQSSNLYCIRQSS